MRDMVNFFIVIGSWKLRHDELLEVQDRELELVHLSNFSTEAKFWECNLNFTDYDDRVIPLAIVSLEDDVYSICSIVYNLRVDKCLFMKIPRRQVVDISDLSDKISQYFNKNYLYSNNHECYFTMPSPGHFQEKIINHASTVSYWTLGLALYNTILNRNQKKFKIQYGKVYEHYRYNVDEKVFFNEYSKSTRKIRIIDFASKNKSWNSSKVTIEESIYDSSETLKLKRTIEIDGKEFQMGSIQLCEQDQELVVKNTLLNEGAFKFKCESIRTGNIFDVGFVSSVNNSDQNIKNYLSISYIKTRGHLEAIENINIDFTCINSFAKDFLNSFL